MGSFLKRIAALWNSAVARLLSPDAELQELVCVLTAFGWGVFLLKGWYSSESRFAVYVLDLIMPVKAWGAIVIAVSAFGFWAYVARDTRLRRAFAYAGVLGWIFVGVLVFRDFHPAAAMISAPIMATASAITYWRLRGPL